ncbi:unnamed protein product [Allacma fusca]|uniref:Fatty acid synthase n=1 Tax=Allacma fusca TaxID=39272 RepID=A0A8J2PFJ1_9HEXA|nr:unnamed protein product [Allacma fusca]
MTKYVESEIVISGISGRFPKSDNLNEFWLNLIEGKDMISDEHDRFLELGLKMPSRMGIVNSLDKFDADFFAIHSKQAITLEPRIRKLLEVSHEAIMDAGLSPVSIHGSNTGVFVATCDSEAAAISHRSFTKHNAYAVLGSSTSMLANRISFFYDLHGPSFVLDTACSSSGVAIHQAMQAIQTEVCDAAIVAGARLHHDAIAGYMFYALDMTSTDGKCKVFDAAADGYARAEAVVAVYICKKEVAKRAYATIVHVGINNDGYKDEGVTYPSNIMQEKVIRKVYKDIGLDPLEVDYFEAHGTGTKVGDPEEMSAITRVFCEGRKGALPIGSVKSNMGHSEPVCSLCSIAKLILSHIARTIPANLHYHTPNPGIPALFDGRVKVVDTNQPFDARYVAINSLGFGGTNVHLLMKFDNKQNNESQWRPSTPVIIAGSGRTEEAVRYFLENALQHKQDQHFVKLLHELSAEAIPRHPYRGYVVANVNNFETIVEKMEPKDALWFIFSGMGSQWPGMTKDLIKFEEFKKSITTSAKYLSSVGFDLKKLLKSGDKSMFEDLKNAMVAITATQIATPTISPLIKWDYGETWYTPHNRQEFNKHKGARFDIDLSNPGDSFYEGHCIEGKIIFPATGYLLLVWKFFSSQIHLEVDQCPVVFQNVRFERLTFLNSETHSTFIVNILQGSGKFEILESDVVVCTGEIRQLLGGVKKEVSTAAFSSEISQSEPRLTKDDFYKELHLRGYNYSGLFQGIQESGIEGNWGKVDWTGDWVSFLDCILQLHILQNENRTLFVPTRIKKIIIDPSEVKTNLQEQNNIITVNVSRYHETAGFPGFELRGLNFANFSSKSQLCDPITTEHVFVSYCSSESTTISKEIALQSIVEIVVENSEGAKFEFTEILSNLHNSVTAQVKDSCTFSFSTCELTTVNVSNARTDDLEFVKNGSKIISLQELAFNPSNHFVYTDCESHFMEFEALLISGGFLLFKCADTLLDLFRGYEIISKNRFLEKGFEQTFVLLRKISINTGRSTVISTDDNDFKWVESAKKIIRNSQVQQVVFASQNPSSGINGFVKCLVKELRNVKIQCFHAIDPIELNFDKPSIYLQQQIRGFV